jgi:hypothetical protein
VQSKRASGLNLAHCPINVGAPDERVRLLASRYARGQDLWSGQPLKGATYEEWKRSKFGDDTDREGQAVLETGMRQLLRTLDRAIDEARSSPAGRVAC